jgi:hypothetical protein
MSTSNSSCETNTDKSNKNSDSECKKSSKKSDSECCPLTSEEIFTKYADAVVQVNGEFWFVSNLETPTAKPTDPLPEGAETFVVCTNVSGFFINKHYIVCPASGIMAPLSITSAVLALPAQADLKYEPEDHNGKHGCGIGVFGCEGKIKEYKNPVTATNISVTINNVNGKCYSFRYRAELVGLDGAGDVAVLYIDSKHPCNKNNPCIEECHPYFKFGSSKNAKIGSTVHLIGDASASNPTIPFHSYETSFVTGTLNNNRYCDPSGWVLSECVSVSAPVYGFSSGLPIIDKCGRVIGMQTCAIKPQLQEVVYNASCNNASCAVAQLEQEPDIANMSQVLLNMGKVIGPSEFMIRKVVKELIDAFCNRKHGNKHIHRNGCGPLIYTKKYLGIAYSKFTAANYDKECPSNEECKACFNQFPGIMKPVSSDTNCCACPGQSSNCSTSCYQLAGIVVDAIAGVSPNGYVREFLADTEAPTQKWFVPGLLCDDKETPSKCVEFLPRPRIEALVPLSPGDVITHIGSHSVCNGQSTFAPAVLLWRGEHDDDDECVSITFRPCACHYEGICTVKVPLMDIPLYADYPWYAIDKFPNIGQMCKQLEFPKCQHIYPLYPALACDCTVPEQVLPFKASF